jgi:hypothetical protein
MTVTTFPDPRFSIESFAVILPGSGSSAAASLDEQRQSVSGQPHFAQSPVPVE